MEWWIIAILVVAFLLVLCFLLSIANFSGDRFIEKYEEMKKKYPKKEIWPLDFISQMNQKYFNGKLEVLQISKVAGDAYSKGKLFLSTETLRLPTLASLTIISHELGHALQDKTGKKLTTLRRLRILGRFLGFLMMPSLLAGAILMLIGQQLFIWGIILLCLGAFIFFLAFFLKLRTISIEKDASKNALTFLSEVLEEDEIKVCKSFLNDARLTYWAEFLRLCLGWTALSRKTKLFN